MFILDTNILISYLKDDLKVANFIESGVHNAEKFIIPTVCIVEFLAYSAMLEKDKENFLALIELLEVSVLDYRTAIIAGNLRSKYKIKTVDSIIAATAINQKATLVSRDKDFKKIKEIEVRDIV